MDMDKLPRATLEQKIEVLDWYYKHGTKSQLYTVKYFQDQGKFGLTKSSFNRWLKDESLLRSNYSKLNINNRDIYKVSPVYQNEIIDKSMNFWYEQLIWFNKYITEQELITQYKKFSTILGIDAGNDKSNGWCYHFKQKNKDRKNLIMKFNDMKDIFQNNVSLGDERKRIRKLLNGVAPQDVYQYDEMIMNEGNKFSIGVLINSVGDEGMTPLIVSNSKIDQPGYYQNPRGIINNEIFQKWLKELNASLGSRKIYILVDFIFEHIVDSKKFNNIEFVWLNPWLQTSFSYLGYSRIQNIEYQPLFLGIWQIFKMLYEVQKWRLYSQNLDTLGDVEIFDLLRWSYEKLHNYKKDIISCFENSGLMPWFNTESSYGKFSIDDELLLKFKSFNSELKSIQQINTVLFKDEQMVNKIYSDFEIIAMVKLMLKDESKINHSVNKDEVQKINRFLNTEMRGFFNRMGDDYKSVHGFNSFLNEFLKDFEEFV